MIGIGKLLKKGKALKDPSETAKKQKQPTEEYKNEVSKFLAFILNEDNEDKIILGKRQDRYFICFKDKYLQTFFSDWFVLMKGLVNSELSRSTYEDSFNTLCRKYSKPDSRENKDKENRENKTDKKLSAKKENSEACN
ncbi:MAG: hypothetical protein LUC97_09915 [Clostridiales bacterium]|nr:hypothetical protein [Clostridiales bacterium]